MKYNATNKQIYRNIVPVARLGWLAPARQLLPVAMVLLGLLLHCSQVTGICSRCEYQVLIGKYNTIPCDVAGVNTQQLNAETP